MSSNITKRHMLLLSGVSALALSNAASTHSAQSDVNSGERILEQDPYWNDLAFESYIEDDIDSATETSDNADPLSDSSKRGSDLNFERTDQNQLVISRVKKNIDTLLEAFFIDNHGDYNNHFNSQSSRAVDDTDTYASEKLSIFHIEIILDQAADLLERADKERQKLFSLREKWFSAITDLAEYFDIDAIHKEEERNGIYDFAAEEQLSKYEQDSLKAKKFQHYEFGIQKMMRERFSNEDFNKSKESTRKAALLHTAPSYRWDGNTDKFERMRIFTGFRMGIPPVLNSESSYDISSEYMRQQLKREWDIGKLSWSLQKSSYRLAHQEINKRKKANDIGKRWHSSNPHLSRQRTLARRKYRDLKAITMFEENGALNYTKRIESIENRIASDLQRAIYRIRLADQGFKHIYGHTMPDTSELNGIDSLDPSVDWTRGAIEWLVRFAGTEQTMVLTRSLKDILTFEGFEGLIDGEYTDVDLLSSEIDGASFVRLRGIGASTISTRGEHILDMTFQPPVTGTMLHGNGQLVQIDQSQALACRLAKVTEYSPHRSGSVGGLSSLHNLSPFGIWKIKINNRIALKNKKSAYIDDILVDFHVAYKS